MHTIKLGSISIANNLPIVVISGPCVMESRDHAMFMAESLKIICEKVQIPFIFKTSFDKANRTSVKGERGMGLEASLKVFQELRQTFCCPIITDVHLPEQCKVIAEVVEILQIPAFLCRQTDLLLAAAATGKVINIKKGQFLAPWDMQQVVSKVLNANNSNIMLCERGSSFGYNNLVVDMRALPIMAQTSFPVIFDATHAVQQPGGLGSASGGKREFAPVLARAAVAVGIAGIFMETHNDPDNAPSDGPNMIYLKDIPKLLEHLKQLDVVTKNA